MSAGTLTLTNNSATVPGAGTTFTTELAAGDFIVVAVGGVPYTLPVKTVNSNTSLTLVSNYTGPTQAGAAWSAVPRVALNMVTAALVAQSAEALRGLNYDKQNWQQLFSGTGTITVRLPDGSTFTGPAWNGIASVLDGKAAKGDNSDITKLTGLTTALSVSQGGTGATKTEDARKNLELGTAATKDVGPMSGNVLGVGYFGFGTPTINVLGSTESGFYGIDGSGTTWAPQAGSGIVCGYDSNRRQQIFTGTSGNLFVRNLTAAAMNTAAATIPWTQLQAVGTSDINFKNVNGDLDVNSSLENICRMEFKRFYYLADEKQTERRGVIAQQIEEIDKEYVHSAEGVGKMTLDLNPLMMDALAAIKALNDKISELGKQVDALSPKRS